MPTDIVYFSTSSKANAPRNAVTVTVRRDDFANGSLPTAFAGVIGITETDPQRSATAAFYPAGGIGEGAKILPFAVDATIWTAMGMGNDITDKVLPYDVGDHIDSLNPLDLKKMLMGNRLLDGIGVPFDLSGNPLMIMDCQNWHADGHYVTGGSDRLWEGLFLPHQFERTKLFGGLLSPLLGIRYVPGNMVLLNLSEKDSWRFGANIANLERQLVSGLDYNDVAGVNQLNGNNSEYLRTPFVTHGLYDLPDELEDELRDSIGKPRILFLYATIPGVLTTVGDLLQFPTKFVIVGWVGAVITEVEFDALIHYVKIQPAPYFEFSLERATGPAADDFSSGVYAGPYVVE